MNYVIRRDYEVQEITKQSDVTPKEPKAEKPKATTNKGKSSTKAKKPEA